MVISPGEKVDKEGSISTFYVGQFPEDHFPGGLIKMLRCSQLGCMVFSSAYELTNHIRDSLALAQPCNVEGNFLRLGIILQIRQLLKSSSPINKMELAIFGMDGLVLKTLSVFTERMTRMMSSEYLCTNTPIAKLFKFK